MFVLDASVTMAWCFEDEASDATDGVLDRLRTESAAVPALWRLEVANVLLVAERRRRLSEAQAAHFLALLDRLPVEVAATPSATSAVLATGRRHRLSAYDAAYLVLAQDLGVPLATIDNALRGACQAAGVTVLPTD